MGFFDFISDAGAKIFGEKESVEDVTVPIKQHIANHGIDTSQMKTQFREGTVVLSGYVPDQEQKEKAVLVAGNVAGVKGVQDNLIVGAPAVGESEQVSAEPSSDAASGEAQWESKTYTVQPGDTLSKIAKEMYGDAMKYPVIFEANRPMLKDPDHIYPGQVLRIPKL